MASASGLAIARALANEPTLLLADEPTGALDSDSGHEIVELLSRLHHGGQTIVLVTHDNDVAQAAEHLIYMRDGQMVEATGPEAGRSVTRGPMTTTPAATSPSSRAGTGGPDEAVGGRPPVAPRSPPTEVGSGAGVGRDRPPAPTRGTGVRPSQARSGLMEPRRTGPRFRWRSAGGAGPGPGGFGLAKAASAGASRDHRRRHPLRAHGGVGGRRSVPAGPARVWDAWVAWWRWPPCWARPSSPPPRSGETSSGSTGHGARFVATLLPALLMAVGVHFLLAVPDGRLISRGRMVRGGGGLRRRRWPSVCGPGSDRAG